MRRALGLGLCLGLAVTAASTVARAQTTARPPAEARSPLVALSDRGRPEERALVQHTCHLSVLRARFARPAAWMSSTAVLVRDDLLLTAGHNLADVTGSRVDIVQVECDRLLVPAAGRPAPRAVSLAREWITANRFTLDGYGPRIFPLDLAVLRLPAGSFTNVSPVRLERLGECPRGGVSHSVRVFGYPGRAAPDGYHMHSGAGPVRASDDLFVSYGVDTQTGVSGGPVWRDANDGGLHLLGVHISEGRDARAHALDLQLEALLMRAGTPLRIHAVPCAGEATARR